MSYFSESKKKSSIEPNLISPSPFRYNPNKLTQKPVCAQTPFGSTSRLNRSITSSNKKQRYEGNSYNIEPYVQYQSVISDISGIFGKQDKLSSNFISKTQRFQTQTIQTTPGPGDYDYGTERKKLSKQKMLQLKKRSNVSLSTSKLKVPSIPSDHLGYREDKNNVMKKVEAAPIIPPDPGSYDIKSSLTVKSNGILRWKPQHRKPSKSTANLPGPGSYDTLNSSQLKTPAAGFIPQSKRFIEDKINKPGPGSYNILLKKKSNSLNIYGNFNSKTSRFAFDSKNEKIGPGQYFNSVKQRVKAKSVTSLKTKLHLKQSTQQIIQKKTIFDEKNNNPGPGQYANTQGITLKLQKQLFRKFNDTTLPKQKRTLFAISQSAFTPGPGTYNFTQDEDQNEKKTTQKQTKPFKKVGKRTQVVNLKDPDQQQLTPSPFDYGNYNKTIGQKITQYGNRMTLTDSKPFGVGEQRFKHYQHTIHKQKCIQNHGNHEESQQQQLGVFESSIKKRKLIMTNIKVKVPFGSSSVKIPESMPSQSPGKFYTKEEEWVRKGHNIRSKLN